ncbi:GDSL-type esterase/lipase family protein [Actinoplanes sp. NPDC051861]|uniref:SGNH/GDSL hydrolase family protein n=1 Tax=Actinoplanes sp. NPDC051861 TaxID=3155170 RepID=UPI00342450AA
MTAVSAFTDDERRHFVRYTRTQRWPLLQRFPITDDGHDGLLAQMLASTPAKIRSLIDAMRDETRAAAARMLAGRHYRATLDALPFGPDDRIVAVGDSITADRLGWFEILAESFHQAGTPAATLVNLGVSGDTTADVLERFDLLEAARPSRVLLMIGTNDAREHGREGGYRMATPGETERNLRALIDLVTSQLGAAITVITPPAVDQERIDSYFRDVPVHWRAAAVAEVADVVRKTAPDAIDLHEATREIGTAGFLEPDGVHPTSAGHQFILDHVLGHLRASR